MEKYLEVKSPFFTISRFIHSSAYFCYSGSGERTVIQEPVANPLKIGGSIFILKVYVLVTAVAPVRAYRHTQGIAQFYSFTGNIQQEKVCIK